MGLTDICVHMRTVTISLLRVKRVTAFCKLCLIVQVKRIWDAFRVQIPVFVFLTTLVLISYFVLNKYTLDEKTALVYGLVPNSECPQLYN